MSLEKKAVPTPIETPQIRPKAKKSQPVPDKVVRMAKVSIQSAPPFAEVYMDGQFLGRTPLEAKEARVGIHQLTLRSKLNVRVDTSLVVPPGVHLFKFPMMPNPEGE